MNKILRSTFSSIRKSKWFTVASVAVMSFSFFILTIFVTVGVISNDVIRYLESRAQITVFFKDTASEGQIMEKKSSLEKDSNVQEVRYTSKEVALQNYMGEHKDDPLLLESLTKDIFPASLDIRAKNISYLPQIEGLFTQDTNVEEVVFYKDALNTFKKFSNVIRYGGLSLVLLLLATSMITVLLTIGSSIYVKNEEISIMRLVGASNWYIRGPFIMQGILYGFFASVISEVFFIILVSVFGNDLRSLFTGVPVTTINWLFLVITFFTQIFFGLLLGLVGSWLAVRRYLKI